MDSLDSANLLSGGSRLLSQSPQFSFNSATSSSSHTGPGGEDLSLSELELYPNNRNRNRFPASEREPQTQTQTQTRHPNPKSRTRPSIAQALGFGAPAPLGRSDDLSVLGALEEDVGEEREVEGEEGGAEVEAEADVTVRVGHGEDAEKAGVATQSREEKLQSDLFVLRQLNGAFAVYNDALREAQGGTERLAEQLEQTDALLNKYINILSKSEKVTRLIFDERWMGAEADEAQLEEEEREREEKLRREEEERRQAAQRERERREKEELERAMREEMERLQREKRDRVPARSGSGVRGVRGTRASVRASAAARGGSRTGSVSSTVGGHSKAPGGTATGPSKIARPSSVAVSSARGTTSIPRGVSKRP